ncbi:aminoacyl-tRNA hydrolase [Priestia flexa]|uniref:aminoacyl-tRNA hydrolase n=1 Tax=Priestia flexa TaxID=86664 RepID=UPI000473347F|nr:aminoacyl-tRNA hydrolase [Priestia flexa]
MEKKSSETKMVIVMRKDLNMTKGKYVAQGSHAALGVVLDIQKSQSVHHHMILNKWLNESYVKVCVFVKSLEELHELNKNAIDQGEAVKLITDNGLTMFNGEKTDTCLAILGYREDVDKLTGHLRLL